MHNAAKNYTINILHKNLVCAKLNQNNNNYNHYNIMIIVLKTIAFKII